jgi:hypothetical protein
MTSPLKVAASRENAQQSTGPRSADGKRRSSGNSKTHGLCAASPHVDYTEEDVAQLVEEIAPSDANASVKSFARNVAHAQLRLETLSRYKVSLIERAGIFGTLDPLPELQLASAKETLANLRMWGWTGLFPRPPDPENTMPRNEPARTDEATRRALRRLIALERYERHELNARSRALKAMFQAMEMFRP